MLTRYFISFNFAAIITFGFFYTMQILISQNEIELQKSDERIVIVLDEIRDPEPLVKREPKPEEIIIDELPKVEFQETGKSFSNPIVVDDGTSIPIPTRTSINNNFAIVEGDAQPIIRVVPQYPRSMLEKGIEGYVKVIFTVTELGATENVSVVESSHRGFERNAIRAAEKFKYKPRVVDGEAVPVKGMTTTLEFNLEK